MSDAQDSTRQSRPQSGKGMGLWAKLALGCGGCAALVVVLVIALGVVGAISRSGSDNGRPSASSATDPTKLSARDLVRSYRANAGMANYQFRDRFVLIECEVSNTKRIFKSIEKGVDPDSVLNMDSLVASMPSDSDLQKEASIDGLSIDQVRGTFPSIGLELSGASRRPAEGGDGPGMPTWGDVLFVFNTHPEALKTLKIGKSVQIVGRVDGWMHESVLVKDCQVIVK